MRLLPSLTVLVMTASLCSGCAEFKERRAAQQDADTADMALAATADADALLAIARARDGRRDPAVLHELAQHASPQVRAAAVRAAGLVGDAGSLGPIEAGLRDDDPAVRAAAAFALSQVWGWYVAELERNTLMARAEEALLAALDEERDDRVLTAIARALGEVGGEPSEDNLWELSARRDAVGEAGLLALAIRGKAGRSAPLTPARLAQLIARAGEEPVAWQATYLAARTGFDEASQADGADWLQNLTPADANAQAWRLRALGHAPAGHPALLMLDLHVRGGGPRDRLASVRAAGQLGPAGLPFLKVALNDEEPDIAAEAARAMGALATAEVRDRLLEWSPSSPTAQAARLSSLAPLAAAEEPDLAAPAVEAARAALDHPEAAVRGASYELLAAWPDAAAADELLARVELETDIGARLSLALAIAARPGPAVEGQLLQWLAGDDPLFGALGAMGLGEREEPHVTERLIEAYEAHMEPADWERRVEIVRTLTARDGVSPELIASFLRDSDAQVRLTAWTTLAERSGRAKAGEPPQRRDYPAIEDPWFGAGDVLEATVTTSRGPLKMVLWPKIAPAAVASFVSLAESGAFDGLPFHRVVPDFVIQGGDPMGTGWGGPGYTLRDEFSPAPYGRGTLGMARSDKDTAGSQWFICHSPQPHLDGHYTAFGQLISGFDVLDAVRVGDTVQDVAIRRSGR